MPPSEIHDRRQRDDRRGHAGQSDSGRRHAAPLVRLIFGNERGRARRRSTRPLAWSA